MEFDDERLGKLEENLQRLWHQNAALLVVHGITPDPSWEDLELLAKIQDQRSRTTQRAYREQQQSYAREGDPFERWAEIRNRTLSR